MEQVNKARKELTITRVFDAPREAVFEAFTTCKHLKNWWGPRAWPMSECTMDFRVGGVWHFCLRGPEGGESWGKAVYREIVKPERIVYTDYFSDKQGNIAPGMAESTITMKFEKQGAKTKLVGIGQYKTVEALEHVVAMGVVQGIKETLDRLEEHLAKK